MDFTINEYKRLLTALLNTGIQFQRFDNFILNPVDEAIVLRHDVDARNLHSLRFARIQNELGIKGTYYFRMVKGSFDVSIVKEIAAMGHEIGYHYEDMDFAKGNSDLAIEFFEKHLNSLREHAEIRTLCMHGSPRSKFDNRDIWKVISYRNYGLIGEPYFDVNYDKVYYLTDTGRSWGGRSVSVRDKVSTQVNWPVVSSTREIIHLAESGQFPRKVIFNFHPQRWSDSYYEWGQEWVLQNVKNMIKRFFYVRSENGFQSRNGNHSI